MLIHWTKPSEQLPYTSQSAFWSGTLSGLRQILLMILLISGLDVALAQEPQLDNELSQELVSARIQALRDTGSQEGAETTVGSYEAVLNWLGEATVHASSEKTFAQARVDAPQQETEIRDRMASAAYRSPDINPVSVSKLSKKELDEKLTALRLKLRDSQTAKNQLDEKLASEQSSSPIIQTRLEAIDKRLQELPTNPVTIEPDLQPSQFEATQWAVLAERKTLNAERGALEARLASQPMRYSRRKAQIDEFVLILNGLNYELKTLETELASRAEAQESKPIVSIDEETPGYGFIRQLVDSNAQLREERANLDTTTALLNEENGEIENQLSSLNNRFEGIKRLVSLAENSASLGHVLMIHWHQTDSFRLGDTASVTSGTIGDHVIQRTRYEDTLNSISDTADYIADGFSAEIGNPEIEPEENLNTIAQELLRSRRELLTALIAGETELVNKSGSLERNRTSLGNQYVDYQAYLGSRILWVPSHPPLSLEILKNIRTDIAAFFVKLDELSFSRLTPMGIVGLVLALTLLVLRRKIDSHLRDINKKVGRVREDSIVFTLRALVLNIIRLAPIALLLLLLANGLQSPNSDTAPYLAKGLQDSIAILLVLLLVRTSCLEIGIARTHFGWQKE